MHNQKTRQNSSEIDFRLITCFIDLTKSQVYKNFTPRQTNNIRQTSYLKVIENTAVYNAPIGFHSDKICIIFERARC